MSWWVSRCRCRRPCHSRRALYSISTWLLQGNQVSIIFCLISANELPGGVEYWNRTNLDSVASRRLKTTRPTQHLPLCTEGEIWTHMPPLILSTPYESEGILRYNVGRMMGFEPMTTRFTVWRSTRWATYSMCCLFLAGRERIEHSSLVLETNILYH